MRLAIAAPRSVAPRPATLPAILGSAALPVFLTAALAAAVHSVQPIPEVVSDAGIYATISSGLIGEGSLTNSIGGLATRGFVFPLLVSAIYAVSGSSPEAVVWFQALVLLPATTLLVYLVGREAFSRRVGLVAAGGFAVWLPAIWHTSWLLAETVLALLMVALAALLAATVARRTAGFAFAAGLTASLLSLSHPAYQLLWIVVPVAALVLVRERRVVTPLAAGVAVVLLPYLLFVIAGLPRLGASNESFSGGGAAWAVYVGSRPETDYTTVPSDYVLIEHRRDVDSLQRMIEAGELEVEPALARTILEKPPNGSLTDSDFYRLGLANLASPSAWPGKLSHSLTTTFLLPDDPRSIGTPGPPLASWFRPIWRPLSAGLALLALGGLVCVLVRRRDRLLVFVPALAQVLVLLPGHVEPRYAVPFWPQMFVLAGLCVVVGARVVSRRSRERQRRRWYPPRAATTSADA